MVKSANFTKNFKTVGHEFSIYAAARHRGGRSNRIVTPSLLLVVCCRSSTHAAPPRARCTDSRRHHDDRRNDQHGEQVDHQVLVPGQVERARVQVCAAVPQHVLQPPGGPLARVERPRAEHGGGGARGRGARAGAADDVTRTCR